jgi:hypothetical protein
MAPAKTSRQNSEELKTLSTRLIRIAHLNLHPRIADKEMALFIGACFWFSVQYQTNDDVAMNLYVAGKGLAQPPSEFLLFQHFLIGSRV